MFPKYFQQELSNLKELGAEFARKHPSLAPMLSGTRSDPDVERVLEGTAFLTAMLRQKLDDEFPEIIHDLLQNVAPQYLNPIPAATIHAFRPKSTVRNSVNLPAGVYCASIPVDGVSCLFKTVYDVDVHPLTIVDASFVQSPGHSPVVKLSLKLNGLPLSKWNPDRLRLYLGGDYNEAADLYYLLRHHLKTIHFVPENGGEIRKLPKKFLSPVGLTPNERLFPSPKHAFPGFGAVQEYFLLPQKFLFLELSGWEQWHSRGDGTGFEILFELDDAPFFPERVNKESFVLHATPSINIFPNEAEPIYLDHKKTHYSLRPSGPGMEANQVYSVDDVKGFVQGTAEERTYIPFQAMRPNQDSKPIYHLTRRPSPVNDGVDVAMSVDYSNLDRTPPNETLSIRLTCTNGTLPNRLRVGDIATHSKGCPEYVTFSNLTPPSPGIYSPVGKHLLWRLLSHLSVGFQSLENVETLKSLLSLYIFTDNGDPSTMANQKRIDGIQAIDAGSQNRLVSGIVVRGRDITIDVRGDHFSGMGDLYLFGSILDAIFANYASFNSFTSLTIKDVTGGALIKWPARMGTRRLI